MPIFDWNSIPDPGGVQNNRPRGSNCPCDLSNQNYDVVHGQVPLQGGVLSVGDVFMYVGVTNASLTHGSSYTVLSVNIYKFLNCTVTTTSLNAPDSVTLTDSANPPNNITVPVDYLLINFSRTTVVSRCSPYGAQIPPVAGGAR